MNAGVIHGPPTLVVADGVVFRIVKTHYLCALVPDLFFPFVLSKPVLPRAVRSVMFCAMDRCYVLSACVSVVLVLEFEFEPVCVHILYIVTCSLSY